MLFLMSMAVPPPLRRDAAVVLRFEKCLENAGYVYVFSAEEVYEFDFLGA